MGGLLRTLGAALIALLVLMPSLCFAQVHVRGYYRKNGTYVQPHMRSSPDGNFYNNWSTKGNVNPYTGEPGTRVTPPGQSGYRPAASETSPVPYKPQPTPAPDSARVTAPGVLDPWEEDQPSSPDLRDDEKPRPRPKRTPSDAQRDANFRTCMRFGSGPCDRALLTDEQSAQLYAAALRANLALCIAGQYPTLCNRQVLTADELEQVDAAERRANLTVCVSGRFPTLCNHDRLTSQEAERVRSAELQRNLSTCLNGRYAALCNHAVLTPDEYARVTEAERRVNLRTCLSGRYPVLCNHAMLTADEAVRVQAAERRNATAW